MEIEAAEGKPFHSGRYSHMCNSLTGLIRLLGLEKRIKDAKTLTAYLAEKAED
jgi:hypothetical protein